LKKIFYLKDRLVKHQMKESPEITPKVILVDGNGILHARSAGIACFLGVKTGIPTIGVGKTFFHHDGLTTPIVTVGIAARIQRFLHQQTEMTSAVASNGPNAKESCELASFLAIDKDCICPTPGPNNSLEATVTSCTSEDMEALAHRCQGFAVRLQGSSSRIWGAALIGHGKGSKRNVGSKNPIFISVGHCISLKESLILCTVLSCNSRIPEPIRQADIQGRELLQHTKCKTTKTVNR
jgi:deoxyinosine 3'endonuclease (endonuclease V)